MTIHLNEQWFATIQTEMRSLLLGHLEGGCLLPEQVEGVRKLLHGTFDYGRFANVIPPSSKDIVFGNAPYISEVLARAAHTGMVQLIPSAGTSGRVVSFRIARANAGAQALIGIIKKFDWNIKTTFFVNCYPLGVNLGQLANSVECTARPDLLTKMFAILQNWPGKVVVIAQPHFLKYYFDHYGGKTPLPQNLDIMLGGMWFPRGFTAYLARHLHKREDEVLHHVFSSYGVGEIGLGIGAQTADLAILRSRLTSEQACALTETTSPVYPLLLEIDATRFFLETIDHRVLVTPLDGDPRIPLIRYDVGDVGRLYSGEALMALTGNSKTLTGRYFLALRGRPGFANTKASEDVEEMIYTDASLSQELSPKYFISSEKIKLQAYSAEHLTTLLESVRVAFPGIAIELVPMSDPWTTLDLSKKVTNNERS